MAAEDAEAIIRKAINDDVFRRSLSSDFEGTMKRYSVKLTTEETSALKKVNWGQRLPNGGLAASTWVHIYKSAPAARDPGAIRTPR